MGEASLEIRSKAESSPFGSKLLPHFSFDPKWKNLNHGSFGTFPRVVRDRQRELEDLREAAPDPFIRYDFYPLLDKSRAAVAKILNCPISTVVLVPNATTGVNTVLRNLVWNSDGKDEILYFRHIYGACLKTVSYVCEANHDLVVPREIVVEYPMEDADLISLFTEAIKTSKAEGKTPRVAMFDTVSSLPGLRMPFEELTAICKEEGVLSLVDGAHGIGHLHLDLTAVDPDFFVSNLHKWLFVPRGCAVFYVPERNQHMMRSSLPTSHGFVPKKVEEGKAARGVLPPTSDSEFINNFGFTGTIDNINYLTVPEAVKFREEVCGGEDAIITYTHNLAKEGGKAVAKILGTRILDNKAETLTRSTLVNVLLPLTLGDEKVEGIFNVKAEPGTGKITEWMQETLVGDYKTFMAIYFFQGQWWVRLSGQVYLEMDDFVWAAEKLKQICERVGKGEFLEVKN